MTKGSNRVTAALGPRAMKGLPRMFRMDIMKAL